jgi:hypothetical protein
MKSAEKENNQKAHAALVLSVTEDLQAYGDDSELASVFFQRLKELFLGKSTRRGTELRALIARFRLGGGGETMGLAIARLRGYSADAVALGVQIQEVDVAGALLRAMEEDEEYDALVSTISITGGGVVPSFDKLCEAALAWERKGQIRKALRGDGHRGLRGWQGACHGRRAAGPRPQEAKEVLHLWRGWSPCCSLPKEGGGGAQQLG